ncbi:MAG TPA: hypothetical protein PKY30_03145, partial [Myxococcota bacterium]|nr:hypothetical protein [Myxococcota bacterium]
TAGKATVKCEVPIRKGFADLHITWENPKRHSLYVENKPYIGFHGAQPGNYIGQLREDEEPCAGFLLLHGHRDVLESARTRLLQQRSCQAWRRGDSWGAMSDKLMGDIGARLYQADLGRLYQGLEQVAHPLEETKMLSAFLTSRHTLYPPVQIPDLVQDRVLGALGTLGVKEESEDGQSFGGYLWNAGKGRHQRYLWLGVIPEVARRMELPPEATLLVKAGDLMPKEDKLVQKYLPNLTWTAVQAGDALFEEAVAMEDPKMEALPKLMRELKKL